MTASNPSRNRPIKTDVMPAGADATARAVTLLKQGEIVALPTETVYGLAADATNAAAVARIFAAKGRPEFNPLIVHVSDIQAAWRIARLDARAEKLIRAFWPGPLTLVLPLDKDAPIVPAVTAGLDTVAIRCPAHPVMREVLKASGLYLAAPSANRSGAISPTLATHAAASLAERVPLVIDGGPCSAGLESTILALRGDGAMGGWQILRPGPVTEEQLAAMLGSAPLPVIDTRIEAPGMLASHYAPAKPVRLEAERAEPGEWLIGFGGQTGDDNLSVDGDLAEAAANLYAALHRADASPADRIAVAPIPDQGMGVAINDRLRRAAA